jgi:hypothetical protein
MNQDEQEHQLFGLQISYSCCEHAREAKRKSMRTTKLFVLFLPNQYIKLTKLIKLVEIYNNNNNNKRRKKKKKTEKKTQNKK